MPTPDPNAPDHLSNEQRGRLPGPPGDEAKDLVWQQCDAQFAWYDTTATRTRYAYITLKAVSLVVAATVPVLAATHAIAALTASLAALVVVIEGVVQLLQLQTNWISYRATAESLRQQGFLYAAQVAPYADPLSRRDILANFLKDITGNENKAWAANMKNLTGKKT